MKLYLLRHGETLSNVHKSLNRTDDPLTEQGKQQVQAAAQYIKQLAVDQVYCSALARAQTTAELLGVNPVFVEALNDRLFGEFTDKPYGSISAYCLAHRLDKETFVPRNGESVAQVKQRVRLFLDSLDDGTYLIIAHAAVIRIIVQLMTGLHWEKVQVQNVALWAIEDNKILHDNWRPWEAKNK